MPDSSLIALIIIIVLAIGFGLVNGFNDAANAMAASVGSRAISPRNAIILAAVMNMVGALSGVAVARTIGKGILTEEVILQFEYVPVIAALGTVIIWGSVATWMGLPVSISHSFVTGLAAAGIALVGTDAVIWDKMTRVGASVAIAPILGFIGGFILMVIILRLFQRSSPAVMRIIFSRLQWLTTAFLAYSHGKNDGQMPIGVITLGLVINSSDTGLWDNIPIWIIIVSALAISSGTAIGGWRVIKTLGMKITALRPVHGFTADLSAGVVIEVASQLGIPVSTTHCAASAVMGIGATRRLSAVRWGVAGNIVTAWVLTFPICGALGYLFAKLLQLLYSG
ncbi:MAG: inorganic phosphate transporter [Dehalococcoidales bacterium]|nr:MAG: inorganic phosphate transporter [Dehalococcoidales bacterium]